MSELTQYNQENREAGDPAPHFVDMHNLVPETGDDKRASRDHNDASPARHIRIDRVQQLCAHNDIDG